MPSIPTIGTHRLILRPPTIEDWPDYEKLMLSDRAVHMGGPFATEFAWGMFCNDVAQWQLFGHGALMMECRETGACFGQVGILHGPLFPERELGWFVYKQAEGKNYAFEAASALRDWAFNVRKFETLVSYIGSANDRSRKLAERLGARIDVAASRPDPTDLVYRHPNA